MDFSIAFTRTLGVWHIVSCGEKGRAIPAQKERLEDLGYADDICLLAQRFCDMEENLKRVKEEAESAGLYRIIHNSLRNFQTRLHNNQDRHSRKELINR